ncbi:MAG: alpha/beta fold hydrolase [Alphaproteobacteria bacterium]|nr:alpha/beta fold hydrolase [Alphaproteobacteria bacterium]
MSTLLLSGWTQPVDALILLAEGATLFDYSAYGSPGEALAALEKINPAYVVGWSLGGQLALRAIAAGAMAPRHLTLIAAPHRFVGEEGMGEETFRLFRESYINDPARTQTRFHGLIAKGDRDFKRIMGMLAHHPQVEEVARWLPWLDALATYPLDVRGLASAPPTLIIHGMNDAIVPYAQSEYLARTLPQARLNLWEGVGHAPHVHDAARVCAEIAAHRAMHGVA